MGTHHTELSLETNQNEGPAGVECPGCCLFCPIPWLPLRPGIPHDLHLHPPCLQAVVKEVEVEVPHVTYAVKETGCTNVFGLAVPCLAEGEVRRKRSADEEAAEEPAAAPVLAYA